MNEEITIPKAWFERLLVLLVLEKMCEEPITVDKKNAMWAKMEGNGRIHQLLGYISSVETLIKMK